MLCGEIGDFLANGVERLGRTVIEVANQAVRLSRTVDDLSMIRTEETFCSPEAGLALKEEEIVGLYGMRESGVRVIEFDFGNGPALVRFIEVPSHGSASSYTGVFADYLAVKTTVASVGVLRSAIEIPCGLCKCCRAKADKRVERAKSLPLYIILKELVLHGEAVHYIKPGPFTELSMATCFRALDVENGLLSLTDTLQGDRLDIDLRFIHMLHVNRSRRGSDDVSVLDLYDHQQQLLLRVTSTRPELAKRWMEICESVTR